MAGKPKSDEHRRKLSEASKGNTSHLGHRHSPEARKKISEAGTGRLREKSGRWKGNGASRSAIHSWLRRHHPPTGICERCGTGAGLGRMGTQFAFKYHPAPWTRNRADYEELCRKCHGPDHPRSKSFAPLTNLLRASSESAG